MSDSDVGGIEEVKLRPNVKSKTTRAKAGSSKAATTAGKGKRKRDENTEQEDIIDIQESEDAGDEKTDHEPPRVSRAKAAPRNNGASTRPTRRQPAKTMPTPNIRDISDEEPPAMLKNQIQKRLETEITRLKQRLQESEEHVMSLSKTLKEAVSVRNSEPEQLLQQHTEAYDRRIQVKDDIIKELRSALAKKEPLLKSGKTPVLQLLTREAADEEKEMLQKELQTWKDKYHEVEGKLAEKETTEADLRLELKMEIERSKNLVSKARNHDSVQRPTVSTVLGNDEPKNAIVIRFYEDLSNFLITNVKPQPPQWFNKEEFILTCIYTFTDKESFVEIKSLSFNLRLTWNNGLADQEVISEGDLVQAVTFIPLELDKESPEFVEKLDFLSSAFTFQRDQLSLFIRSLHDKLGEAIGYMGDESESS